MTGIEIIANERARQIEVEGFGKANDAMYIGEELAIAAACYALPPSNLRTQIVTGPGLLKPIWPWDNDWWKPSFDNRIKELAKAGALIAAEIDRIQNKL